ncbi:kinase-like domain-containing protein [Pelagophyceae sp. CCMP2097]|nr:kinase-like domain-containing protein [Pelagophyceae sp. CCMP2097]|mmetsp:Transcript_30582/g.105687  ORF Transcript_30582/g.105687 Transcript_30582/m.105687 type:complete len:404 (-) Transcript_30582:87-1298(-)
MSFRRKYHSVPLGRDQFYIDVRYRNLKPIGGGSYGVVCSADDTATGKKVAIKKIANVFSDLVDAKRILREIKLLRHFGLHENIVQVKDIITVPPNTIDFSDVYIVTNLMESDLDRIITSRQPLTNQHHQYFLYQILRGLKFIHSASVLHRDLKPSNLLVNSNCDLAICDFGLARGVDDDAGKLTEYVVTRWYRAPELLCETDAYDEAIDVWSVGCIFAEMLRRKPFFRGDTPQHQLETIVSVLGKPAEASMARVQHEAARKAILAGAECEPYPFASYFPRDTSATALDLLAQMLVFDPDDRIKVDAALEHPYLAELHGQMVEPLCDDVFDFEFERANGDDAKEMPKEDIQSMMFEEMVQLQLVMEDGDASKKTLVADDDAAARKGEGKDAEPEHSADAQADAK